MHVRSAVTAVTWMPSDPSSPPPGVDAAALRFDTAPPERLEGPRHVHELCREDRFRFAQVLSCWIRVEEGRVVEAGHADDSGLVMESTAVRVGPVGATFRAAALPVVRPDPVLLDDEARFVQTVGGRTGVPLPRPVPHRPFLRWWAPIAWTTLELVLRADGTSDVSLRGASAFPRHRVYDAAGRMVVQTGVADHAGWTADPSGERTPWGLADREALAVAAESELERLRSAGVVRGAVRPEVRRLEAGELLAVQGGPGSGLLLVLDGVVRVEAAGAGPVAEVGPGAMLDERALHEDGVRTASLVAATPVRVAVVPGDAVDRDRPARRADDHPRVRRA